MEKIFKYNDEHVVIDSEIITEVRLSIFKDVKTLKSSYSIDVIFNECKSLLGSYNDIDRANEVLKEVNEFIKNNEATEYVVPLE